MSQIVAFESEITTKHISENKGSEIADMREIPNRRTANIKFYLVAAERREFLGLPGQIIVKSKH